MAPIGQHAAAAGHIARRLFLRAALVALIAAVPMAGAPAFAGNGVEAHGPVSVSESDGVYRVAATFTVAQPPAVAFAVLTDFEWIPQYVPDMKVSTVLERNERGTVVEQEAVARLMMFSKRVHLILHVSEDGNTIRFRDKCGRSFAIYEGEWIVQPAGHGSTITYRLAVKPSFDVPAFVLKRLMKRDATDLIASITTEINAGSAR